MNDFDTFTKIWEDWGKLIVAKGFKKFPKVQNIAQSGHTATKASYRRTATNTSPWPVGSTARREEGSHGKGFSEDVTQIKFPRLDQKQKFQLWIINLPTSLLDKSC